MTHDLFSAEPRLEWLPIPAAEVAYISQLNLPRPTDVLLSELIETMPWRPENITVWGKKYVQPRLIAWFGDPGFDYSYSGLRLEPLVWTRTLLEIKSRVEMSTSTDFNSVLLNYYRDHRDSMGFHSDDEPELGKRPTIASLSLGAERTFILKHKFDKTLKPIRLKLGSGSLLLMKGDTQKNWQHGIDKETRPCGPRINLTFRHISL